MRHRSPGKVCEGLWMLGREESCLYLLEGRQGLLLLNGGLSYLVPDLRRQMEDFGLAEERICGAVLLHAHFDHIGVIPYIKRRHPGVPLYASARAWEILRTPRALDTINAFSRLVADRMGRTALLLQEDLDWRDDITGILVREGDRLPWDGPEVAILETPGHSSCAISAWVPSLRVLFPSDAAGIPVKNTLIAAGNSHYTRYQESLKKLALLPVVYACADHYGWLDGEEARRFLPDTIAEAEDTRALMEDLLRRTGSVDATVQSMLDETYRRHPDYFLAREIYEGVCSQMVRHIAGALDERGSHGAPR